MMYSAPSKSRLTIFLAAILLLPVSLLPQPPDTQQPALQQPASLEAPVHPATTSTPRPPLIVIGFAGGFIRRTSAFHGEIALSLHLSKKYGNRIHSEVFENHHGNQAHREILRLVHLSETAASKSSRPPDIILYGHSWGASEAVHVARELQHDGIPVQLLVEVDGVRKRHQDDSIIPSNVAQAINFYQTEGLLHGRPLISAADPASTQIIDNIHLTYKDNDVPTPGYSWFTRTFTKRHIQIESDPRVWDQVEAMITASLPPA